MSTNPDPRKAAEESLQTLVAAVQAQPPSDAQEAFLAECAALAVAIRAFHMEGIRFRMFNVDRTITRGAVTAHRRASARRSPTCAGTSRPPAFTRDRIRRRADSSRSELDSGFTRFSGLDRLMSLC